MKVGMSRTYGESRVARGAVGEGELTLQLGNDRYQGQLMSTYILNFEYADDLGWEK